MGLGGLVGPDGEDGGEEGAHGPGDGQPEPGTDGARVAEDEGPTGACAVGLADDGGAPAGGESDQAEHEEDGGEALDGAAEGEDGATAAAAAAHGHQGEEVGQDLESKGDAVRSNPQITGASRAMGSIIIA